MDIEDPKSVIELENGVKLRDWHDFDALRSDIYNGIQNEVQRSFPINYGGTRISLSEVEYADPDTFSIRDQKKHILQDTSLTRRLRGRLKLEDEETGEVLDEKTMTLMNVPHLTNRGTFIDKGSEYTMLNQLRLLPGPYARRKKNMELEVHMNTKRGSGSAFRVRLEPEKALYKMDVGGSSLRLYSLLHDIGVSDEELLQYWDNDILDANKKAYDPRTFEKAYQKLVKKGDPKASREEKAQAIRDALDQTKVTKRTASRTLPGLMNIKKLSFRSDYKDIKQAIKLAQGHMKQAFSFVRPDDDDDDYVPVGVGGVLESSRKLLDMNRGLVGQDERDSLVFKTLMTPDRLMSERVRMDADQLRRNMARRVSKNKSFKGIQPGFFNEYIGGIMHGSPLALPLEEINPMHLIDQHRRITHMGQGGLPSRDVITPESQCHSHDTEVFTKDGWKLWPEVDVHDLLACRVDDRLEFHKPKCLWESQYDGVMYGVDSRSVNFLVSPNHRFYTASSARTSEWYWETAEQHHGKFRVYLSTSEPYLGSDDSDEFNLPEVVKHVSGYWLNEVPPLNMGDFCEFLGWYLSEGSHYDGVTANRYCVTISQCPEVNPSKCDDIKSLLDSLPFSYNQKRHNFKIKSRVLYEYVSQFGKCKDKFIPDFLFEVKPEYRRRFLEAFLKGDGSTKNDSKLYFSSSLALVVGIERLLISCGASTSLRKPWSAKDRSGAYTCWLYGVAELVSPVKTSKANSHYTENYSGNIYCATVEGGMLLTRRGGSAFWSGNSVHPSQFGFISPLEGPECHSGDTEVLTDRGMIFWPDVRDDDKFACWVNDKLEYHQAIKIIRKPYKGRMILINTPHLNLMVTPNHRLIIKHWLGEKEFETTAEKWFGQECHMRTALSENKHWELCTEDEWSDQYYEGRVFCAAVPGGLLYTRREGRTLWSGNSEMAGIDVRAAWGTRVGSDGNIYRKMKNRRSGKMEWTTPVDLDGKTVLLPA